ncbi:MAG: nickel transporter, partial [Methanomicrobiales archaeon]|nr:nickel transporter [Methanomicrobiales archaeon]
MDLILAMDLKDRHVVHGKSGQRDTYRPLDWGLSPTAEPVGFVKAIAPKFIYIADLDRITGKGSHDQVIRECARMVSACYVDRGSVSPADTLEGYHITNIIGTETGGEDLSRYRDGFLSLDLKGGRVIPSGRDPVDMLRQANGWNFSGCIILNIDGVGTGAGMTKETLDAMRSAYHKKLFWGGGVGAV